MRKLCTLLIAAATPCGAAESGVMIVKAARLIDGRGGAPFAPAMVRVEGDRIAAVAQRLEVPAGARVIDLGRATLLPGLIDLHTHLTDKPDVHWEEALLTTTPSQAALWGAHNALVTLRAGVTTCRDMGPTWPYVDVDLREAIEQGAVPGPRLLVAGNYVSSTGGAGDARQFSLFVDVPIVRNLADGPEEVVKAVRTNFDHGSMLDDEAIAMLRTAPTYYVPTLYISQVVPGSAIVPESEKERARKLGDIQLTSFQKALAAGLPIGLATDVPVMPHGENAKELSFRVRLGEAPMSAIVSATRVNAEILGWSDRVGTVEAGRAGLIAVAGDPLADIKAVERVSFVMKAGVVYRNDFTVARGE